MGDPKLSLGTCSCSLKVNMYSSTGVLGAGPTGTAHPGAPRPGGGGPRARGELSPEPRGGGPRGGEAWLRTRMAFQTRTRRPAGRREKAGPARVCVRGWGGGG